MVVLHGLSGVLGQHLKICALSASRLSAHDRQDLIVEEEVKDDTVERQKEVNELTAVRFNLSVTRRYKKHTML